MKETLFIIIFTFIHSAVFGQQLGDNGEFTMKFVRNEKEIEMNKNLAQKVLEDMLNLINATGSEARGFYAPTEDNWSDALGEEAFFYVKFDKPVTIKVFQNQEMLAREIVVSFPELGVMQASLLVRSDSGIRSFTKFFPEEFAKFACRPQLQLNFDETMCQSLTGGIYKSGQNYGIQNRFR